MPARSDVVRYENPFSEGHFSVPNISLHFSRMVSSASRGWNNSISAPVRQFWHSRSFFSRKIRPWFAAYNNYTHRVARDMAYGTQQPARHVKGLSPEQAATLETHLRRYITLHNQKLIYLLQEDDLTNQMEAYTAGINRVAQKAGVIRAIGQDDLAFLNYIIGYGDTNIDDGEQPGDPLWEAKNEAIDLYNDLNLLANAQLGVTAALHDITVSENYYRDSALEIVRPSRKAGRLIKPWIDARETVRLDTSGLEKIYSGGLQNHTVTYLTSAALVMAPVVGILLATGVAIAAWPITVGVAATLLVTPIIGASLAYFGYGNVAKALWYGGYGKIVTTKARDKNLPSAETNNNLSGYLGLIGAGALAGGVIGSIFPVIGTVIGSATGAFLGLLAGLGIKNYLRAIKAFFWTGPIDGIKVMFTLGFNPRSHKAKKHVKIALENSFWSYPLGIVFGSVAGTFGLILRAGFDFGKGFLLSIPRWIKEGWLKNAASIRPAAEDDAPVSLVSSSYELYQNEFVNNKKFHPFAVLGMGLGWFLFKLPTSIFAGIVSGFYSGMTLGYNLFSEDSRAESATLLKNNFWLGKIFMCLSGLGFFVVGVVARAAVEFVNLISLLATALVNILVRFGRGMLFSIIPWCKEGWDLKGSRIHKQRETAQGSGFIIDYYSHTQSEDLLEQLNYDPVAKLGMCSMYGFKFFAALAKGVVYGIKTMAWWGAHPLNSEAMQAVYQSFFVNNSKWSLGSAVIVGIPSWFIALAIRGIYDFGLGIISSIIPWLKQGWHKSAYSLTVEHEGIEHRLSPSRRLKAEFLAETRPLALLGMYLMSPFILPTAICSGLIYGAIQFFNIGFNPLTPSAYQEHAKAFEQNSMISWIPAGLIGLITYPLGIVSRIIYDFGNGFIRAIEPWVQEAWDYKNAKESKEPYEWPHQKLFRRFWSKDNTHPFAVLGMALSYIIVTPLIAACSGIVYGATEGFLVGFTPLSKNAWQNFGTALQQHYPILSWWTAVPIAMVASIGGLLSRIIYDIYLGITESVKPWMKEGWNKKRYREVVLGKNVDPSDRLLNQFWQDSRIVSIGVMYLPMYLVKIATAAIRGIVYGVQTFGQMGLTPFDKSARTAAWQALKQNCYWSIPTALIAGSISCVVAYFAGGLYDVFNGMVGSIVPWWKEGWDYTGTKVTYPAIGPVEENSEQETLQKTQSDVFIDQIYQSNRFKVPTLLGMYLMYPVKIVAAALSGIRYGIRTLWNVGFNSHHQEVYVNAAGTFVENSLWSWPTAGLFGAIFGYLPGVIARISVDILLGIGMGCRVWSYEGWDYTKSLLTIPPDNRKVTAHSEIWKKSLASNRKWIGVGMWLASPVCFFAAAAKGIGYGLVSGLIFGYNSYSKDAWKDLKDAYKDNHWISNGFAFFPSIAGFWIGAFTRVCTDFFLGFVRSSLAFLLDGIAPAYFKVKKDIRLEGPNGVIAEPFDGTRMGYLNRVFFQRPERLLCGAFARLGMLVASPIYAVSNVACGIIFGFGLLLKAGFNPRSGWKEVGDTIKAHSLFSYFSNPWVIAVAGIVSGLFPAGLVFGTIGFITGLIARALYDFGRGFCRSIIPWTLEGWVEEGWDKQQYRKPPKLNPDAPDSEEFNAERIGVSGRLRKRFWDISKAVQEDVEGEEIPSTKPIHPFAVLGWICGYPFKVAAAFIRGIEYGSKMFFLGLAPRDAALRDKAIKAYTQHCWWSVPSAFFTGLVAGTAGLLISGIADLCRGIWLSIIPWAQQGWDAEKSKVNDISASRHLFNQFWNATENKKDWLAVVGMALTSPIYVMAGLCSGIIYGSQRFFWRGYKVRDDEARRWVKLGFEQNSIPSWFTAAPIGIILALPAGLLTRIVVDFAWGIGHGIVAFWRQGWNYTAALQREEGRAPLTPYQLLKQQCWQENHRHLFSMLGIWLTSPIILISATLSGIVYGARTWGQVGFNLLTFGSPSLAAAWQHMKDSFAANSGWSWIQAGIVGIIFAAPVGIVLRILRDFVSGLKDGFNTAFQALYNPHAAGRISFSDAWNNNKDSYKYFALPGMLIGGLFGIPCGLLARGLATYWRALRKEPCTTLLCSAAYPFVGIALLAYKAFTWTVAPIFVQPWKLYKDCKDFGGWSNAPNKARRAIAMIPVVGKLLSKFAKWWSFDLIISKAETQQRHWFKKAIDRATLFMAPPKYDNERSFAALQQKFGIGASPKKGARRRLAFPGNKEIIDLLIDAIIKNSKGTGRLMLIKEHEYEFSQNENLRWVGSSQSKQMLKYLYNLIRSGNYNDANRTAKHSQWRDSDSCGVGAVKSLLPLERNGTNIIFKLGKFTLSYNHANDYLYVDGNQQHNNPNVEIDVEQPNNRGYSMTC